jgi:hypothetical protein
MFAIVMPKRVVNRLSTATCKRFARSYLLKSGRKGSETDIRRLVRRDAYEIAFEEKESH